MKKLFLTIGLLAGISLLSVFAAEAATVSIANSKNKAGDTVTLPVRFYSFPSDVSALQLKIKYDPKIITDLEVVNGDFTNTATLQFASNISVPGELLFSLASAQPLPKNGVLAKLNFRIADTKSRRTVIRIISAKINESDFYVSKYSGRINILQAPVIKYLKKSGNYFTWWASGLGYYNRFLKYRYRVDQQKWGKYSFWTWRVQHVSINTVSKHLAAGKHTFAVEAKNLAGITSEIKEITFEIKPPRKFVPWYKRIAKKIKNIFHW
ncbi:MAG: cohesin domain-containing protein [Candidatus Omnitrophota bacterium]